MGNLTLNGATSGQITISPPAVAGTNTLTLPAATGTVALTANPTFTGTTTVSNLAMNGSSSGTTTLSPSATASGTVTIPAGTGTVAVQGVSTNIVSSTAQASTSGTNIDFTGIPSWLNRITVMFNGVGTNGSSLYLVQIGSGSIANTGYISDGMYPNGPTNSGLVTTGLVQQGIAFSYATDSGYYGSTVLTTLGLNIWVSTGANVAGGGRLQFNAGSKTLSGTLDRIRITTVNGTDTFNAGSINILYE